LFPLVVIELFKFYTPPLPIEVIRTLVRNLVSVLG
jgi:hypothetical protein